MVKICLKLQNGNGLVLINKDIERRQFLSDRDCFFALANFNSLILVKNKKFIYNKYHHEGVTAITCDKPNTRRNTSGLILNSETCVC